MGGSSRRPRLVGLAGSVVAHGLCAAVLAWLPAPDPAQPSPVSEPVVVELVSFDPPPLPPESSALGSGEAPASAPAPTGRPRPKRRARSRRTSDSRDSEAGVPEAPPRPVAGGLSLRGHRAGESGAPAPPPPPTSLVRPLEPRSLEPRRAPKRAPADETSTLGDFGFVRGSGGAAVRDDPSLPFVATIHSDGSIAFRHRKLGRFKYYALKTRIQKETFSLRLAMVRRWSRAQSAARLRALGRELRAVWSRPIEADARRRLLFELWDDCLERSADAQEESQLDRERAQIGVRARALIVKFVARELPQSSVNAYSPTELRRLNGRRVSRARFAPYGPRGPERSQRPAG